MVNGVLILFRLRRKDQNIEMKNACKLYRKLYGYNNSSYYGRYHNRVPGLLDGIKHIRYINSVIIVRKEDSEKIIKFLKEYNADVHTWEVKLSESEANLLA